MVTDEMVEIAARSDAKFDRRPFDGLGRADKQRYLDRSRAALEAALAVVSKDDGSRQRSQGDSDEQSSHGQFRPSAPGGFHGSDVPHLRSHR